MSRSRSRRRVSTQLRASVEAELSRARIDDLLKDVDFRAGLTSTADEVVAASDVQTLLNRLCSTGPRAAIGVIANDFQNLSAHAVHASIDRAALRSLESAIGQVKKSADAFTDDQLREQLEVVTASLAELSTEVVDAVADQRAGELTAVAAIETLTNMGFDVGLEEADGEIMIRAVRGDGQLAEMSIDGERSPVEACFEDPATGLHPLDPRAGELCHRAVATAAEFDIKFGDALARRGVHAGPVESIETPTRGARANRASGRRRRIAAKRRSTS